MHKLVNRQMSHMVFAHHFVLHVLLFQAFDNTKREARHFGALKRHKNTTGRRKSGKNVIDPFYANWGTFSNSHMSVA